jgi:hypothetical protein
MAISLGNPSHGEFEDAPSQKKARTGHPLLGTQHIDIVDTHVYPVCSQEDSGL